MANERAIQRAERSVKSKRQYAAHIKAVERSEPTKYNQGAVRNTKRYAVRAERRLNNLIARTEED